VLDANRSPEVDALMTFTDRLTGLNWPRIGAFGHKHRLPTVCEFRFLAQAGCLITYGPPLDDLSRHCGAGRPDLERGQARRDAGGTGDTIR